MMPHPPQWIWTHVEFQQPAPKPPPQLKRKERTPSPEVIYVGDLPPEPEKTKQKARDLFAEKERAPSPEVIYVGDLPPEPEKTKHKTRDLFAEYVQRDAIRFDRERKSLMREKAGDIIPAEPHIWSVKNQRWMNII
jgi:hypothetical protein